MCQHPVQNCSRHASKVCPPNLLHMGLSKQTLETLGITLGKKTVNNVENVEHQGITYVIQTFS